MLNAMISLFVGEASTSDLEKQITDNSQVLDLEAKYSGDEIEKVHKEYNIQEDAIQKEIDELGEYDTEEYHNLRSELEELKDREDEEVKRIEEEQSRKEADIKAQNSNLQTRLDATNKNNEGFKELANKRAEDSFGYFKS